MGQQEIQLIRDHKERPTLAGASSFAGMAILERLHARGWKPVGLTRTPLDQATGIQKWRLERLKAKKIDVVSGIRSEDGTMTQWIQHHRPKYWIHHFHFMDRFREADYDVKKALAVGLDPLEKILKSLSEGGCRGLVHSGSYFEPGEGGQSISAKVSPYAESKRQIWLTLKELADRNRIPVAKVVLPNAIGPGENADRLIPMMIRKAKVGESLQLHSPGGTAENIPAASLAEVYEMALQDFAAADEDAGLMPAFYRPSVGPKTHQDFAQTVNQELIQKGLALPEVKLEMGGTDVSMSSIAYANPSELKLRVNWEQFWKEYVTQLKTASLFDELLK